MATQIEIISLRIPARLVPGRRTKVCADLRSVGPPSTTFVVGMVQGWLIAAVPLFWGILELFSFPTSPLAVSQAVA